MSMTVKDLKKQRYIYIYILYIYIYIYISYLSLLLMRCLQKVSNLRLYLPSYFRIIVEVILCMLSQSITVEVWK